ncbi:MAG: alpha-L-fucosidase C-terminal domain-containing protein, partial [Ferruginibacter sp.]
GKTRYIFLFEFPESKILLKKIPFFKNEKVQLLGSNKNIIWKQAGQGVEISLPPALKTTTDHVWVLKVTSN